MKHIRDQIIEFLEAGSFTANDLSRESGVNAVYISRVKTGVRMDMASSRADAIREAMLKMDPEVARKVGVTS